MSSILIKGLNLPHNGGFINIRLRDDRAEVEVQELEYKDFEIEEVPEPHGRLIDADALYQPLADAYGAFSIGAVKGSLVGQTIKAAPTVIEAEEART